MNDLVHARALEPGSSLYIDTTGIQLKNGLQLQDNFISSTPMRFLNFLEDSYDELDVFVRIVPWSHLQCMLSSGDGRQSMLHFAARNDRADRVSWLLENGASYTTVDHKGFTPLHRAIEGSCHSATLAFFEYFSRIADGSHIQPILHVLFRKNHMHETPLFTASLKGDSSVLKLAIGLLNSFSVERDAFLEGMRRKCAAVGGNSANIAIVIDHINKDDKNFTLLHAAILRQSPECLEILLRDYKISVNSLNNHKHTPLHLAYRSKNQELVELLLQYGADKSLVSAKELQTMTAGGKSCRRNRLATR
jgi:ankyrin repeat protein